MMTPTGSIVPKTPMAIRFLFFKGDKNRHTPKLEGASERLLPVIKSKSPGLLLYGRRSEGLLTISYHNFATITVTHDKSDFVWNPKISAQYNLDMHAIKRVLLEEENIQWCG